MAENKNIEVGGRLHSIATGNVLAGANEVFDDDKGKKQNVINTETYSLVNDINERLSGLSPDQQSALSVATKATNNETKLGYYVCDTESNVAAKVIADATGYILSTGGSIKIKMTNANTVNNATLNINSTGAKALYYAGERASANNSWEAGETVEVYYDGTSFYANSIAGGSGSGDGAFDISAKTGDTYETLSDALTAANSILSASKKKGGMSIKFIQTTPATYTVVKTEGATEQPTGTELQSDPGIISGTYTAGELSIFSTLPATLNSSLTYYLTVTETVDEQEVTTYTTWVITYVRTSDNKYVQYRLMSDTFNTDVANWQGVDDGSLISYDKEIATKNTVFLDNSYTVICNTANYGINLNGNFSTNKAHKHVYISVVGGEKYHVDGITDYELRIAFATTQSVTAGTPIPVVEGTNVVVVPANTNVWIKIPEGCSYLLLWRNNEGSNFTDRVKKAICIDDEPTANSNNLVKSGGISTKIDGIYTKIKDVRFQKVLNVINKISDTWTVTAKVIFEQVNGLEGTLICNASNQAKEDRPYFYIGNLEHGKTYRIRFKVTINSQCDYGFRIANLNKYNSTWSEMVDIDGNAVSLLENGYVDCVFVYDYHKPYIATTFANFDINDTFIIEDFTIDEVICVKDIEDIKDDINTINDINTPFVPTWKQIYHKEDIIYKKLLTDTGEESLENCIKYLYVIPFNEIIHAEALISSDYYVTLYTHTTLRTALFDDSTDRIYIEGGDDGSNLAAKTLYKGGETTIKNGYLCLDIRRVDGAYMTNEDVSTIENDLMFSFFPVDVNEEKAIIKRNAGCELTQNDFTYFVSDSQGRIGGRLVRAKFVMYKGFGNTLFDINISSAKNNIPGLLWGLNVHSTKKGAWHSSAETTIEKVVEYWSEENISNGIINCDGYLCLFFKKDDDTSFTYEELIAIYQGVKISLRANKITEYEELPLGLFVNKEGTGEVLTDSSNIISSPYITCVPHTGITYRFVLPNNIQARFVYGTNVTLGSVTKWVTNGTIVTMPENCIVHRIQFKNIDDSDITAEEISNAYKEKLIKVLFNKIDDTVYKRNYCIESYVKGAMYRLGWSSHTEMSQKSSIHSMPTFIHVSDIHGDMKRFENAVEYANTIEANAILATGDLVINKSYDGIGYLKDVISKHTNIPLVMCIGNHETEPRNTTLDNSYLFSNYIEPYIEQGNYRKNNNTPADMPYYFVDIEAHQIRLISINQFDNACYGSEGKQGRIGQAQISWLCNTLLSTPENYGVIILLHANEDKIDTPEEMNAWNQTVDWSGGDEDVMGYCVNGLYVNDIRPIKTIIDAFISRESINITYNENTVNGNDGELVTIDSDFSNVANGVEFICYVTGHRHMDNIGYIHTASNKQLILNMTCTNAHYAKTTSLGFAEHGDLPRGDSGITQDAFNVYVIDRQNGRVKIARVGSNVNFEGVERKFLIAPYKD